MADQDNAVDDDLAEIDTRNQQENVVPTQGTVRPDLFGDSESDEEEAPPPSQEEARNQAAASASPLAEAVSAELLEDQDKAANDATSIGQQDEEGKDASREEAEPAEAPEAEEAFTGRGDIDDVFASDSEDDEAQQQHRDVGHISEAEEEEDEFEAMFSGSKKKKRAQGRTREMVDTVEGLISSMELAAEMDNTENEAHKPAVHKIKMLASVQTAVGQTNLHKELLDAGFLGALKLWIEPLPDFSLPNVKVRTAVLSMLQRLPIDLNQEGRKTQLKKSQLGKYVAFYSKLQDETLANRQSARALVENWSRTIYEQYKDGGEEEAKQEQEAQLALQRKRRQQAEARQNLGPVKKLKQGEPGFRWHATIPAPAKLDYMRRPDNMVPAGEGEAVKGKAKPRDRMSKKLAAMSRKGSRKGAGDGKVSLQGRGLLL